MTTDGNILRHDLGTLFPPNMTWMGGAMMLFGLFGLIKTPLLLPLILLGYWMAFRRSGIEVDIEKDLYRPYTQSFGLRRGRWQSITDYPDVAVLRGREGFQAYSRAMVELNDSEVIYQVYLLTADHRRRLLLWREKDKPAAEAQCRRLADLLQRRCTSYAPVISERTRRRRR